MFNIFGAIILFTTFLVSLAQFPGPNYPDQDLDNYRDFPVNFIPDFDILNTGFGKKIINNNTYISSKYTSTSNTKNYYFESSPYICVNGSDSDKSQSKLNLDSKDYALFDKMITSFPLQNFEFCSKNYIINYQNCGQDQNCVNISEHYGNRYILYQINSFDSPSLERTFIYSERLLKNKQLMVNDADMKNYNTKLTYSQVPERNCNNKYCVSFNRQFIQICKRYGFNAYSTSSCNNEDYIYSPTLKVEILPTPYNSSVEITSANNFSQCSEEGYCFSYKYDTYKVCTISPPEFIWEDDIVECNEFNVIKKHPEDFSIALSKEIICAKKEPIIVSETILNVTSGIECLRNVNNFNSVYELNGVNYTVNDFIFLSDYTCNQYNKTYYSICTKTDDLGEVECFYNSTKVTGDKFNYSFINKPKIIKIENVTFCNPVKELVVDKNILNQVNLTNPISGNIGVISIVTYSSSKFVCDVFSKQYFETCYNVESVFGVEKICNQNFFLSEQPLYSFNVSISSPPSPPSIPIPTRFCIKQVVWKNITNIGQPFCECIENSKKFVYCNQTLTWKKSPNSTIPILACLCPATPNNVQ